MNTSEIPRRAPADYWSSVPIATTRRASIFRAPTRVERPSFTFPIKLAGRRETSWSRLGRRSVKLERSRRRRRRSGGGEAHDDGSTVDEPSFSGEKKRRVSRKQHHDPSIPRSFDLTILRSHDPSIPRSFDPTILRSVDLPPGNWTSVNLFSNTGVVSILGKSFLPPLSKAGEIYAMCRAKER